MVKAPPLEVIRIGDVDIEIPNQAFIDRITHIDELLQGNVRAMGALARVFQRGFGQPTSNINLRQQLTSGQLVPYDILTKGATDGIVLDAALTDEPFECGDATQLTAATDGVLDGISIKFNTQNARAIPIKYFNPWYQPFFQIYLTVSPAQAGKKLYLAINKTLAGAGTGGGTFTYAVSAYFLNLVTPLDSTITVLGDGATYTSAQFSVLNQARIIGTVLANRNGTLYVDQSSDGTNYDYVTSTAYVASDTMGFSVEVVAPYARVRFTNAAGAAQTTFRLYAAGRRV